MSTGGASPPSSGALSGYRIVDLTRVYAGPACTQMLADAGADVIKIEPPQGDETRDWGPPVAPDVSAYYWGLNRNKRNIALDLSREDARAIVLRLLESADVLIDNFKLGTMEAWGLGYEATLARRFPRLVHCTISGFGTEGPLAGYPGYDAVVQGFAGIMSINGEPNREPLKTPFPVVDMATGLYASSAILMALVERERSGKGQHIDLSLYDVGLTLMHPISTTWTFDGKNPKASGNVYAAIAPYGIYASKDKPVLTGAGNDDAFRKLCAVIGCPTLADDERFAGNRKRVENRAALDAEIGRVIAQHDGESISLALMRGGVAAGVVQTVADAFGHPQTVANKMLVEVGGKKVIGSPIRLSRTPMRMNRLPGSFGADTAEVLRELGCDAAAIEKLEADGAVYQQRRGRGVPKAPARKD